MADHDAFIDALSATARPVKPVRPSGVRVAGWMAAALPCGAIVALFLSRSVTDWSQPGWLWAALELCLSLGLGALSVFTAFDTAIAGRKSLGWPVFALVATAWLASGLMTVAHGGDPIGRLGGGTFCYGFMVLVSLPMIPLLVAGLRRTRTLYPVRSLALGGMGVACMTMTLLSLCHPVEGDLVDFVMHILAGVTIVGVTVVLGQRFVGV